MGQDSALSCVLQKLGLGIAVNRLVWRKNVPSVTWPPGYEYEGLTNSQLVWTELELLDGKVLGGQRNDGIAIGIFRALLPPQHWGQGLTSVYPSLELGTLLTHIQSPVRWKSPRDQTFLSLKMVQ